MAKAKEDIDFFARKGWRTLVLAQKVISDKALEVWMSTYYRPATQAKDKEKREELLDKASEAIETHLELMAVSAIEDELQDYVPETIARLRMANIAVWMITGDKTETAVSIGQSTGLLSEGVERVEVTGDEAATVNGCNKLLKKALDTCKASTAPGGTGLIMDGPAMRATLGDEERDENLKLLEKIAGHVSVAVCCRAEPLQKALITKLVKGLPSIKNARGTSGQPLVLSVGDGANDVPMIKEAHVGVGISGQEGRQASMAADYAIGQFSFLSRLILVHGHWSYDRLCKLTIYTFWKSNLLCMILFFYMPFNGWSGQHTIDSTNLIMYASAYNSIPPIMVGILDQCYSAKDLMEKPELYMHSQASEGFSHLVFWPQFLESIWEAAVIFFIPYWTAPEDSATWVLGVIMMSTCAVLSNIKMLMFASSWTRGLIIGCVIGSLLYYAITFLVFHNVPSMGEEDGQGGAYYAIYHAMDESLYYLQFPLIIILGVAPNVIARAFDLSLVPLEKTIDEDDRKTRETQHRLSRSQTPEKEGEDTQPGVQGDKVTV